MKSCTASCEIKLRRKLHWRI